MGSEPPPESLSAPPPPPPREEDVGLLFARFDPSGSSAPSSSAAEASGADPTPADAEASGADPTRADAEASFADLDLEELGVEQESVASQPPPLPDAPASSERPEALSARHLPAHGPESDRPTPVGAIRWDGAELVEVPAPSTGQSDETSETQAPAATHDAPQLVDDTLNELGAEFDGDIEPLPASEPPPLPDLADVEFDGTSEPPPMPGSTDAPDLDPTVLDAEPDVTFGESKIALAPDDAYLGSDEDIDDFASASNADIDELLSAPVELGPSLAADESKGGASPATASPPRGPDGDPGFASVEVDSGAAAGPEVDVESSEIDIEALGLDLSEEEADVPSNADSEAVGSGEQRPLTAPELSDERPAPATLSERGMAASWHARAEQLESLATTTADGATKGRYLLVASELWAMLGEVTRARAAARKAAQAAPTSQLAKRQSRVLAAQEGDWQVAGAQLDAEARSAEAPEARAHAAIVSAEIRRLVLADDDNARRRQDLAQRAWPADPRPTVVRLAHELGSATSPPKTKVPAAPELEPLGAAIAVVRDMRGGAPAESAAPSPTTALLATQRHLADGRPSRAVDALGSLSELPSLREPALWLQAALAAPLEETRAHCITALRSLLSEYPNRRVCRTLVACALDANDREAVRHALESKPPDGEAFTSAERIALRALSGLFEAGVDSDAESHPVAMAAMRTTDPDAGAGGSELERAEQALGNQIADSTRMEDLHQNLTRLAAANPKDRVVSLFELERKRALGNLAGVASGVASWPASDDDPSPRVAAAILTARAGAGAESLPLFLSLLGSSTFAEFAARGLSEHNPSGAPDFLKRASAAAQDPVQQTTLLYETALRQASESAESALATVEQITQISPTFPLSYTLGDRLARLVGDPEQLRTWLRRRRETSDDPMEQALDAVREALLVADSDPTRARNLLEAATAARPTDIALSELHERLAASAPEDRGKWRQAVASELSDSAAASSLLIEAALEYERASDLATAATLAAQAAERQASAFARVTAERLALHGPRASELSSQLVRRAEATTDPEERRALYEQLDRLELGRNGQAPTTMWHQTILETSPGYLPSLHVLEQACMTDGRDEDLEPIASAIARRLRGSESSAHAMLAARIRCRDRPPIDRIDLVELVLDRAPDSFWALRDHATLAELTEDPAKVRTAYERLTQHGRRPLDVAAFRMRAAEAAVAMGDPEGALGLLDAALEAAPEYVLVRAARARVREQMGQHAEAAEDLEAVASVLADPVTRSATRRRAGILWLEQLDDLPRAIQQFEAAAEDAPDDQDLFDRLQLAYVRAGDRGKLADLLQRRAEATTDPEARVALEVTRSRALADLGDRAAARQTLDAALEANPDHADALEVYANLCTLEGDYRTAEKAWIRLAKLHTDRGAQADVYANLGSIYFEHIQNLERADRCYREVLKRRPHDEQAAERLVSINVDLGRTQAAIDLQSQLIERADDGDTKRDRVLTLARIHNATGDKKSAIAILEKARKAWPDDDHALRAQVEIHQEHGEMPAAKILLDRAANEARRALGGGQFDPRFFSTLATVAELRGEAQGAAIARATLAAIEGRDESVSGGGASAGDSRLDDLIAPDALSPALRAFFKKLAGLLDAAYPVDLRALRAAPPPAQASDFVTHVRTIANKLGIQGLEVLVSPTLNATWLPASATPPRLVVGQALLDSRDQGVQKFALFRALKVVQSQGAALTRMSPVDLGPVVGALLATFAKTWQPQGIDAERLAEAKNRIEAARLPRVDDDVPTLALEVAGSLGDRAIRLGTAYLELGNRAALLATGDPAAAIRALALAVGAQVPDSGPERLEWVTRNPEARDLAVFSVSDGCTQARQKLGLE